MSDIRRTFIIGDEWLYYKFYSGAKTSDIILTRVVGPLADEFLKRNLIDKWFFIRYSDPKYHTRVRFHLAAPDSLSDILQTVRRLIAPYVEQNLIWKVQTDTYQREIERYGPETMEASETVFFYDSRLIVGLLALIRGDEDERNRWLFGLRAIDALLDDFDFSLEAKAEYMSKQRERTGAAYLRYRSFRKQIEEKFRKERPDINAVMKETMDSAQMKEFLRLLSEKSACVRALTGSFTQLAPADKENDEKRKNLIGSFSHMLVNRLFKSKAGTHEFILYDFLSRYYRSEIGRRKSLKASAKS